MLYALIVLTIIDTQRIEIPMSMKMIIMMRNLNQSMMIISMNTMKM